MSGRRNWSLELSWGVGLAIAVGAALLTRATVDGNGDDSATRRPAVATVAVASDSVAPALPALDTSEAIVDRTVGDAERPGTSLRVGAPASTNVMEADAAATAAGTTRVAAGKRLTTAAAATAAPSAQLAKARSTVQRSVPSLRPDTVADAWADSVLATLSLRAKAGQLVFRWISGGYADSLSRDVAEVRRWIAEDSVGGFIISIGSATHLVEKTNALQRASALPLLFAADMEFGPGHRIVPGGAIFPAAMGIAATGDTAIACAHGRVTAEQARAVGIQWIFAPTVDVNTRATNPIVNTRTYGETAATVARYAVPFIRCAERAGLMTTAKHFAAHGEANVDSHIATPVVMRTRAGLDRGDFLPFRAAQRAGVSAIMSAHVALPAVSGDSVPASLNPKLLQAIVRDEWHYDGLIVSDALWMGGAAKANLGAAGELAVRALLAGNDVVLDPIDHRVVIAGIVDAVRAGTLSESRLDESVRRVLRAKARMGLQRERTVPLAPALALIDDPATAAVVRRAAERSLVAARGGPPSRWLAALRRGDTVRVFAYLDEGERPAAGLSVGRAFSETLAASLAPRGIAVVTETWTPRSVPTTNLAAVDAARSADAVILAPYIRPLALKGSIGLPATVAAHFRALLAVAPDAALISFGDPYLVQQLPVTRRYLLAWNPWSAAAETAAARALGAGARVTGQLPVTLGGTLRPTDAAAATNVIARPGADDALMQAIRDTVRALLDRAVADSAFPGAIAMVGTHARVLAEYGAGRVDYAPDAAVPDARTLYDVASLTKVVGTTAAAMRLVDRGRLQLDAPVRRYLPRFTGEGRERVTVRQLLTHSSGLPAGRDVVRAGSPRDAMTLIYETPLAAAPGTQHIYSDVGAVLLGEVVRVVAGEPLDRHLRRAVFTPLGMTDTGFRPDATRRERAAPTEFDPARARRLVGEVHDPTAAALGGVAGNAGLFSTAADLARFARAMLNDGRLGDARLVSPGTVAAFARRQSVNHPERAASSRALGWDTPTGESSAGRLMSPVAFGHTGFTGTSLWMDPASDVFIVLLSNRVDPARTNGQVSLLRAALSDAVLGLMSTAAVSPAPSYRPAP